MALCTEAVDVLPYGFRIANLHHTCDNAVSIRNRLFIGGDRFVNTAMQQTRQKLYK